MCKTDKEYLKKLKNHVSQTRTFLSNKMKPERERAVCRAFLRGLGISFQECELIAPTVEPEDVAFRCARFQVRDLLEQNRRRGDDWKEKEKKYGSATCISQVTEQSVLPTQIKFDVLIPKVAEALSKKVEKYGDGCANLDALVYVDLKCRFLEADTIITDTECLKSQGWRSVSLLYPPYSVVLLAAKDAPSFLKDVECEIHMK